MNMRDATTGQGVVWCIFFLKLALFPIFIQMRNLFCYCLACSYVGEWRVGLWPRWNGGEIGALNSEAFILSSVPAVPWISRVSCCHIAGTDSERNFEMQTGCVPSWWTMRKLHWHKDPKSQYDMIDPFQISECKVLPFALKFSAVKVSGIPWT